MKAIIFDLFRTLVDPEGVYPTAYKRTDRMAQVLGIDPQKLAQWWIDTKRERNLTRVPTLKERLEKYLGSIDFPVFDPKLVEVALYEADRYHLQAVLHPHVQVIQVLEELRRKEVKIGVLSNCDEHEIQTWPQSPLVKLVDAVALSVDTGLVKPGLSAYSDVLEKLKVSANEAMFVGDGENRELAGAKASGFARVVFLRQFVAHSGFHSKESMALFETQADVTLDDLRTVLDYF